VLPGTTPAQVLLISVAQAVRTSPKGAAAVEGAGFGAAGDWAFCAGGWAFFAGADCGVG
jgi:hypothetical protein